MIRIPETEKISQEALFQLLQEIRQKDLNSYYESSRHQLIIESGDTWLAKIYLSWNWEWGENEGLKENPDPHFALGIIKAGQAALGYFHRGELLDHRVFRAYMVRQKQGKSQIKHLKTKGKSRAGSRIRLAETERFFEEINERLNSYHEAYPISHWGISCSKTLWPYFFSSKLPPPFASDSNNLIELPFHLSSGSFEELKIAGSLVSDFHVIFSEEGKKVFSYNSSLNKPEEEDW